jgi:FMN phosphatase YigB (HAD superfamily)
MIKHIWFDFSETIALLNKEVHNQLRYQSYAAVIGKPVSETLITEFEELYKKYNHSNAAIFRSLGLPSGYWSDKINSIDPAQFYRLADKTIPDALKKIKSIAPISLFSNIQLGQVLPVLGIDPSWFSNILSSGMLKEPKPALEGFYKMIELSHLPPSEIMYVGDHVGKDVLPAKQVGIITGLMWNKSPEADYCFENFNAILKVIV